LPLESAGQSLACKRWRKVRAPQGTVPGNAWAARADGKCNRKIPPMAVRMRLPLRNHHRRVRKRTTKWPGIVVAGAHGSGKGEMVR
jgi:hypothetical protein